MANVNNIINYCLRVSYKELENFAGENYQTLYYHFKNRSTGEEANTLLIGTIFTCIATNGRLSEGEWNFIAKFIGGYTYDEALSVAGEFYCQEAKDTVKGLVNALPYDLKDAMMNLCIAVLCCDGRIDSFEKDFFNEIF